MNEPMVCAVMLTSNRAAMARRAVECWRNQAYARKRLCIYNCNTADEYGHVTPVPGALTDAPTGIFEVPHGNRGESIGKLRNQAMEHCDYDIICHFDDDDWSNPSRISEQVALLQSSGADAVGYNSAVFWDSNAGLARLENGTVRRFSEGHGESAGEAWLYTAPAGGQALGASLMFWRKTWERQPFRDVTHGEDLHFQLGLKVESVSSLADGKFFCNKCGYMGDSALHPRCGYYAYGIKAPRLICTVHGGNTSTQINPAKREWKRAAEWDEYCRKALEKA